MGFIKSAVKELVLLLALNIVLVSFMVFAPLIFVVLPLLLIFDNPSGDFFGLAQFFFWTGPLSCALWMLLSCHWQSVRHWQRMGRLDTWRQDHGGLVRTVTKATGYMFGGLFASFFFEMVFLCVFRFAPYSLFNSASRFALWFAMFSVRDLCSGHPALAVAMAAQQERPVAGGLSQRELCAQWPRAVSTAGARRRNDGLFRCVRVFEAEAHKGGGVENDFDKFEVPAEWREDAEQSQLISTMREFRDMVKAMQDEALR